jgi:polyhydroxyalkanoate synthesis regulator phasin
MNDTVKNSLLAGLGAIDFSVEKVKETVDHLVERGELSSDQARKVIAEMVERGKKDSTELGRKIDAGIRSALEKVTIVTKPDWDKLERRVAALEEKCASSCDSPDDDGGCGGEGGCEQ